MCVFVSQPTKQPKQGSIIHQSCILTYYKIQDTYFIQNPLSLFLTCMLTCELFSRNTNNIGDTGFSLESQLKNAEITFLYCLVGMFPLLSFKNSTILFCIFSFLNILGNLLAHVLKNKHCLPFVRASHIFLPACSRHTTIQSRYYLQFVTNGSLSSILEVRTKYLFEIKELYTNDIQCHEPSMQISPKCTSTN